MAVNGTMIITAIAIFIALFVQGSILFWLARLEKMGCECAMDWRRKFIMFYLCFLIVSMFARFVWASMFEIPMVALIMFALAFVNIGIVMQYIQKLKRDNCECSESLWKTVMYYLTLINAIMIAIAILFAMFLVFTLYSMQNKSTPMTAKSMISTRKVRSSGRK